MYRLLAIDLDDTLLTPKNTITQYTFDMLQKAVDAGMVLVIATGRVPYMLPSAVRDLPLHGLQITSNGAMILDLQTNDILSALFLPIDRVKLVLDEIRQLDLSYCYYARDRMYVEPLLFDSFENRGRAQRPEVQRGDKLDLQLHPCLKIAAFGEAASLKEKRQELDGLFKGEIYITQTSPTCLEFLHPEVSKANALKIVMHSLDIQAEEAIAFGDSDNDLEMLRLAGFSVAMANATAEVKAVANYVTSSNSEDGVATALEKILFSQGD